MQSIFEHSEDQVEPPKPKDSFLAVRIVLLIAAGISAFTMPWLVTFGLGLAWILAMVWPHKA